MRVPLVLIFLFSLIGYCGMGQELDALMTVAPQWESGKIILQEGEVLTGQVYYDDLRSVVYYRKDRQEPRKIYVPNEVSSFEFDDSDLRKKRVFYTLVFEDSQKNVERPLFFEAMREFDHFAILLKIDPAEFNQPVGSPKSALRQQTTAQQSGHVLQVRQVQTLCFMNAGGEIEPYISLEIREIDGILTDRVRNKHKTFDRTLPEKYFGKSAYDKMQQYARENKLDLGQLRDFLKVATYYAEVLYSKA